MATAERWRRFGHDRLYVTAADGAKLGHLDLRTSSSHDVPSDRIGEFREAVRAWTEANPDAMPKSAADAGPPRQPAPPQTTPQSSESAAPPQRTTPRSVPPPTPPGRDLAANQPGQAAAEVAAAYRDAQPFSTRLFRLLGRHTKERAWRIGAAGEVETADRLRALTDPAPWRLNTVGPWRVLHSVPVGDLGSDIDHVLIGPPGVFTINTKTHPGKLVWANPKMITVDKHKTRYAEIARRESDIAGRLLTAALGHPVPVAPVISVVGGTVGGNHQPLGVTVVPVKKLVDWLLQQPASYSPARIETVYAVARRSSSWQPRG